VTTLTEFLISSCGFFYYSNFPSPLVACPLEIFLHFTPFSMWRQKQIEKKNYKLGGCSIKCPE
jgi:hypothetical protein